MSDTDSGDGSQGLVTRNAFAILRQRRPKTRRRLSDAGAASSPSPTATTSAAAAGIAAGIAPETLSTDLISTASSASTLPSIPDTEAAPSPRGTDAAAPAAASAAASTSSLAGGTGVDKTRARQGAWRPSPLNVRCHAGAASASPSAVDAVWSIGLQATETCYFYGSVAIRCRRGRATVAGFPLDAVAWRVVRVPPGARPGTIEPQPVDPSGEPPTAAATAVTAAPSTGPGGPLPVGWTDAYPVVVELRRAADRFAALDSFVENDGWLAVDYARNAAAALPLSPPHTKKGRSQRRMPVEAPPLPPLDAFPLEILWQHEATAAAQDPPSWQHVFHTVSQHYHRTLVSSHDASTLAQLPSLSPSPSPSPSLSLAPSAPTPRDAARHADHEETCGLLAEHHSANAVIALIGNRNTGKSSLLRYLVNRLIPQFGRVAVLDVDLGQNEFTPPGYVSLTITDTPLFSAPFAHIAWPTVYRSAAEEETSDAYSTPAPAPAPPTGSFWFWHGDKTPRQDPAGYLATIAHACRTWHADYAHVPLLVNTAGWTHGFGLELLSDLVATLAPAACVAMTYPDEANPNNLPLAFREGEWLTPHYGTPNLVNATRVNAGADADAAVPPPRWITADGIRPGLASLSPQDGHALQFAAWFGAEASPGGVYAGRAPHALHGGDLFVSALHAGGRLACGTRHTVPFAHVYLQFPLDDVPRSHALLALYRAAVVLFDVLGSSTSTHTVCPPRPRRGDSDQAAQTPAAMQLRFLPAHAQLAPEALRCLGHAFILDIDMAAGAFEVLSPLPAWVISEHVGLIRRAQCMNPPVRVLSQLMPIDASPAAASHGDDCDRHPSAPQTNTIPPPANGTMSSDSDDTEDDDDDDDGDDHDDGDAEADDDEMAMADLPSYMAPSTVFDDLQDVAPGTKRAGPAPSRKRLRT